MSCRVVSCGLLAGVGTRATLATLGGAAWDAGLKKFSRQAPCLSAKQHRTAQQQSAGASRIGIHHQQFQVDSFCSSLLLRNTQFAWLRSF